MATAPHTANEQLAALVAAGTAPWLDQIRRGLITSGELERLRDDYSLRGVTSNPTIFEQAILGSTDYDEELQSLAREGLDATALYERTVTASSRSRSSRTSRMTPTRRSPRRGTSGSASTGPT
jgi:transaldolase